MLRFFPTFLSRVGSRVVRKDVQEGAGEGGYSPVSAQRALLILKCTAWPWADVSRTFRRRRHPADERPFEMEPSYMHIQPHERDQVTLRLRGTTGRGTDA